MNLHLLEEPPPRAVARLTCASLTYLSLPVALFLAGWLRWYLSLPLLGLMALAFVTSTRRERHPPATKAKPSSGSSSFVRQFVPILIVASALLSISGIGGLGYQDSDWLKHNAVLKDLIERPWPVQYDIDGQEVPLVYYVAYYLPAAALGKAFGWNVANWVLLAWSMVGVTLALLWFQLLARRAGRRALLLFAVFSGLDVGGQLFTRLVIVPIRPEVGGLLTWTHLESWPVWWQYSANTTLLFWAPNQALAGWLATALVAYRILDPSRRRDVLLTAGLAAFWSPFVALGLLPYLVLSFLLPGGRWAGRIRRIVSLPNLTGVILVAVAGLYYSAKLYPVSSRLATVIPHGFFWSMGPDPQARRLGVGGIVVFCLLEFGLYSLLIYGARRSWSRRARALYPVTVISLSLIPLYRYGAANDLAMRASIPALFILCLLVTRTLNSATTGLPVRAGLILLIALGSATAFVEVNRHVQGIYDAGTLRDLPAAAEVTSVNEWGITTDQDAAIVLQYVGGPQAPFFRHLARERR
jgi:hypothetical protein